MVESSLISYTRADIAYAASVNNGNLQLEAYTNADWAGSLTDRISTVEYCTLLEGNLVMWRSKKQSMVARSRAEVEVRAITHGICELLGIKIVLIDLKVKT
ncbi:putative mitochondrial protein [Vitis vinifera]|uniref:Putative mitochondrial protein n=1 Tax=Vitis vinifera TaxID=29760 RepID=A0A438DMT5_VITVI|nr:putative mitochondrial protein [Vitis vinifera]